MNLMGHGGVYDELGQIATMLGTGHADQRRCGERIDAVRDALEAIDRQHKEAVEAERTRIVELLRREAEGFDDPGGVLTRLADHIAIGGQP